MRPARLNVSNIKTWVEEKIWGHRFYNDQTPWLLLLEFLGICAHQTSHLPDGRLFPVLEDGKHEDFSYNLPTREALRYLLFRDRHLEDCERGDFASDHARFEEWVRRASADGRMDFSYLKRVFVDFDSLSSAVNLLRSAEIEQHHERRWTSRHLAPQGPAMLAADYRVDAKGTPSADRRFFARGGEILYLMLNRSHCRNALEPLIRERLLSPKSHWNQIVEEILPDVGGSQDLSMTTGYLPLPTHPRYDTIADDWHALLSLPNLPPDYVVEPLVRMSALGVILYLTERASEVLARQPPPIPVDLVSSGNSAMRKLSIEYFHLHRQFSRDAITHHVLDFTEGAEWRAAKASANPPRQAMEVLHEAFLCRKILKPKYNPEQQIEALIEQALKNHNTHLGRVGGFYAQKIGLAIARTGVGRWFSLSDSLLEALVLTNVVDPLEYSEFLQRLWVRYRMVIGPAVAEQAFDGLPVPREQFKANQERLEERLRVLGLLRRLSDDCAFVENPFA